MKKITIETKIFTIALILVLTFSVVFVVLPAATAQEPPRRKTYAFIGAIPNPVGVNQEVLLHVGITDPTGSVEIGWEDLTVTIEKPDGQIETITDIRTDATGGTGVVYVPNMVGTYKLQTHFPEQVMKLPYARGNIAAGTIMEASESEVLELVVQEDQVAEYPIHELPREYWTRPIDTQLREWQKIAGNWQTLNPLDNFLAPYNEYAPETPHILWTRPIEMGGLIGGEYGYHSFEMGAAYEDKFADSAILGGVLYYNRFSAPHRAGPLSQGIYAIDLHTGEELWFKNSTRLEFGQILYWDSYNYHGGFSYLWEVDGSTWHAYDAFTGEWVYTMENVPPTTGRNFFGPNGDIIRYTINYEDGWMTKWNSTSVVSDEGSWARAIAIGPPDRIYDATEGIQWNVTIPTDLPAIAARRYDAVLEDRILGSNLPGPGRGAAGNEEIYLWGISTAPGHEGELLFNETWVPPTKDLFVNFAGASVEEGVFVLAVRETTCYYGFDLDTGKEIWGPTESMHYLSNYDIMMTNRMPYFAIADDKLISTGTPGIVYAFDVHNGETLWKYEAVDPYNEILWSSNWPLAISFITDGKIYLTYWEHSPIDRKRGGPFLCLDMDSGDEIWRIPIYASSFFWQRSGNLIADSVIVAFSAYDCQLYAIGKGPSAISVVSDTSPCLGSKATITGSVLDVSPGTNDPALKMRFPYGVPAVSDEDMTEWMLHVYKQFERPNVNGVTVRLEAIDPNGNYQNYGTTTTDPYGTFGFSFDPEVPGLYMLIATFEGSDSYYGSTATTFVTVNPAPAPSIPIEPEQPTEPEEPREPEQPAKEAPLISTEVALVVAVAVIAVIGVAAYWLLRRRK
jgi:outer membrane protein assembly factor BamB